MASSTHGQILTMHARLKKSADFVRSGSDVGQQVQDAALYVVDIYPLSDPSDGSAQTLPDLSEIRETLHSLLPSLGTMPTEEFMKSPLFPVTLLRDIAMLFGFRDASHEIAFHLELSDLDKGNKSVMTLVWFLTFLGFDIDTI